MLSSTTKRLRNYDWCSSWDGTKYDLVFYGVSGYTGYLCLGLQFRLLGMGPEAKDAGVPAMIQCTLKSGKVNLGDISTDLACGIRSGVANRSKKYSRPTLACCLSCKDDGVPQARVTEASLGAPVKPNHVHPPAQRLSSAV